MNELDVSSPSCLGAQVLTFAEFRLDPERGQLLRGATPVALTPKAFALLEYLATRAGRLVSKQELLDAIWPNVFVGEAVLKGTIRDVRRALGDDSHAPQFIQTAHRRGYRFVAPVVAEDGHARPLRPLLCQPSGPVRRP